MDQNNVVTIGISNWKIGDSNNLLIYIKIKDRQCWRSLEYIITDQIESYNGNSSCITICSSLQQFYFYHYFLLQVQFEEVCFNDQLIDCFYIGYRMVPPIPKLKLIIYLCLWSLYAADFIFVVTIKLYKIQLPSY